MEKEVFVQGKRIIYFEEGEGPPLLIIHGWGNVDSPKTFFPLQKILAEKGFKVYLPYLPGFGGSDKAAADWRMADYLNLILALAKVWQINDFYLLGHSFGGTMAIKLAVHYPEKIRALMLLTPAIRWPRWFPFEWLRFILFHLFLVGLSIFRIFGKLFKEIYQFYLKDKMAKLMKRLAGEEDTIKYLKKIKAPTLVIWGNKDFYNPPFISSAVKHIVNHTLVVLPEAGHSLQSSHPEKLTNLISEFLSSIDNDSK